MTPVLVVINHDANLPSVEVYGEKDLLVHIVNKVSAETSQGQILAEQLLDNKLPRMFKPLYFPVKLRSMHVVHRQTAEERMACLWNRRDLALAWDIAALFNGQEDVQNNEHWGRGRDIQAGAASVLNPVDSKGTKTAP